MLAEFTMPDVVEYVGFGLGVMLFLIGGAVFWVLMVKLGRRTEDEHEGTGKNDGR